MTELIGPAAPWTGLLDALGVLVVLGVWYAVRNAGDRARTVAVAAGAAMFALALSRAANRINGFVAWNSALTRSQGPPDGRTVAYAVLAVAGIAAGALVLLRAHRAAADAAEDLADDALVPGDDDEPDDYTLRRRRLVAFAPWLDLAALALALGLPVLMFGPGVGGGSGGISAWVAVLHVLSGVHVAGPLLLVAHRADLRDARPVTAAFAVVAAGVLLRALFPDAFANEWWSSVASGLAVGLLAAAGFMLVTRALADDRAAVTAGVLVAVAVGVLTTVVVGQVFGETFPPQELGPDDVFGEFPGEIEGEFPDWFTPPPG